MNNPGIVNTRRRTFAAALVIGVVASISSLAATVGTQTQGSETALLAKGINPHPVKLIVPEARPLSAMAQLGRTLFHDTSLSGSGHMACATCHDIAHAYGPPGAVSVMIGGPDMHTAGFRAVPSLRYLYRQPPFSIGLDTTSGDNDVAPNIQRQAQQALAHDKVLKSATSPQAAAVNLVPQGGIFWDGRANTLQQQASVPLLNSVEMAASAPEAVVKKLESENYAAQFRALFGPNIFMNAGLLMAEAMFAVARYQIEDSSFHPFTSKFDAWLQGKVRLTPIEARGYLAFNDPAKGNCAACHLSKPTRDGLPPLFTDFQYEALGVPRNTSIPANRDANYYDLGICGPYRTDMRDQVQYCGMFLTPTLRNTATRKVFFHNGVFHSLDEVMDWYVNRDLHPERFYSKDASGNVVKYDDVPAQYRKNVDTADAPFNRHPGDQPALNKQEIQDIIAFLRTLTDGYSTSSTVPDPARVMRRRRSNQ
ncbi:MAG TPA: cytochrome c peroxidase [Rhizomicrobium sp.]|nr:cytochrome c peroxidase [Rhizomicrobium sp.]